jgi:hypothetical protein
MKAIVRYYKMTYAAVWQRFWMQIVLGGLVAFSALLFFGILILMSWCSDNLA